MTFQEDIDVHIALDRQAPSLWLCIIHTTGSLAEWQYIAEIVQAEVRHELDKSGWALFADEDIERLVNRRFQGAAYDELEAFVSRKAV